MTTEERYLDDTFVLSSISRELVEAATRKDLRGLQQLLEQHSNYLKSNINSPIIIRTEDSGRSYLSLLQYVLFCFSMEDEQENERSSPIIQMLIDSGADLNADFVFTATFPTGTELCTHETFLSILAQAGKLALVKLLLKNKARVVRQSETFFGLESLATAFLLAASGVQSTVTEISALTCAVTGNQLEIVKLFLSDEAMQRSLQEDAKLDNPAETELRQLISVASLCGFSEVLKVLLEQEAQLRFPEQYSTMSPLDGAMALNDESAVACVLQDLSITEDQFSKAIQWLLSKNSVNVTFETAVDLACSREHFNALRTLLTEQAKLTFAEHGIMTHLDKAIALNCEAAVAHLLSNDLTISEDQLSKALQWLLNQKLLDDCTLKTAISLACKINKLDALKTLLKQQTKLGKTPLESAMELEDRSSVKYLLAKDLTVTAKEYVKAILWLVTNKAVDLKVCWLIWCIPTMLVRKAFSILMKGIASGISFLTGKSNYGLNKKTIVDPNLSNNRDSLSQSKTKTENDSSREKGYNSRSQNRGVYQTSQKERSSSVRSST